MLIVEDIFANVRGMVYIDVGVGFAADVGVDVDCITKAEVDPHSQEVMLHLISSITSFLMIPVSQ